MKIDTMISMFKALGQKTRLQIIRLLAEKDLCVCELTEILKTSQPRISQHLKVLKEVGIVKENIEGPMRIYYLRKEAIDQLFNVFATFLKSSPSNDDELNHLLIKLKQLDSEFRYNKDNPLSKA